MLCEVSAAVSLEQCWELLEAVGKSRKTYMMAENYCYWRSNVLVRELVRQGLFGEVYFGEGEYVSDMKPFFHGKDGTPTWRHRWLDCRADEESAARIILASGFRSLHDHLPKDMT